MEKRRANKTNYSLNSLLIASLLLSTITPTLYAHQETDISEKAASSNNAQENSSKKNAIQTQELDPTLRQVKQLAQEFEEDTCSYDQAYNIENDEIQEAIVAQIDKYVVSAIEQLKKVDTVLEELAQIVQNGLVKTNKRITTLQIKALRSFINQLINNPFSEADLETINFLVTVSNHFIDIVYQATKRNLKNIADINPEKIIPKTRITSIEQLEAKLKENEKKYLRLEKAVKNVGLSWTNWLYRTFFVAPAKLAKKYHIPTITKWGLLTSIITTYVLYRFENKYVKDALGEPPKMNQYGELENKVKEDIGKLGKLEYVVFNAMRMPAMQLFFFLVPILLYKDLLKIRRWSKKQLEYIHFTLMGGIQAKQASQKYGFSSPRFTFDNVVGLEHVKQELKPLIEYLKNCARFERVGIGPEKGYLFAGKPGTGKSFMAEALAGEIKQAMIEAGAPEDTFKFIPFEASEIYGIISEKGISEGIEAIMHFAKENAPCVVFIDEPDLLGLQRTSNAELLSKLLNVMNGFLSNNLSENVIILAATNRPDNLDPALLRRGRLGKIIHFEYPTFEARKKFLQKKLNPIVADLESFNLDKIAKETEGSTFEGLQSMIRKAFQNTKIRGTSLTQEALEKAMNEEIRQILSETKNLSEKELNIVAAQQAATAIVTLNLEIEDKLACVTINPVMKRIRESSVWDRYNKQQEKIIQQGKMFTYKAGDTSDIFSRENLLNTCKILLAGDIGEEILLGSCGHSYYKENKEEALKIALSIIAEGYDLEKMPKELQQEYYKKAIELLEQCKQETQALLQANKEALIKLSAALLARKTLDVSQVEAIIKSVGEKESNTDK